MNIMTDDMAIGPNTAYAKSVLFNTVRVMLRAWSPLLAALATVVVQAFMHNVSLSYGSFMFASTAASIGAIYGWGLTTIRRAQGSPKQPWMGLMTWFSWIPYFFCIYLIGYSGLWSLYELRHGFAVMPILKAAWFSVLGWNALNQFAKLTDDGRAVDAIVREAEANGNVNNLEIDVRGFDTQEDNQATIDQRLIWAIDEGNIYTVDKLFAQGASPNARTSNGMSALMFAASCGNLVCIGMLIAKGAEIDAQMEGNGVTALMFAVNCDSGKLDGFEYLISHGADVNATDNHGNTALMFAVELGRLAHADFLLSSGADIDAANDEGITALMRCCMCGTLSCLELLFSAGADPFIEENEYTRTAVDLATVYDNVNCLKFLMSNGIESEETLRLASMFSVECLKYLVANGADVNRRAVLRSTPLMEAAEEGNLDCIKFLVANGADVNAERGLFNSAPLTEAATYGRLHCVEYLISVGANVNNEDTINYTVNGGS